VLRDRLPAERLVDGQLTVPPDLAIEVVSPNDLAYEVEGKVQEYREAGVRLLWIVYPPTRAVYIHRSDGSIAVARADDDLTGEDLLPGFRCRVSDLFAALPPIAPEP